MRLRHFRAFLTISLLALATGCNSQTPPGPAATAAPAATTASGPAAASTHVVPTAPTQASPTASGQAKPASTAAAQSVAEPKAAVASFKLVNLTVPSLIAFSGNGIAVATPDGKTIRQLPTDPNAFTPKWSPDGRNILFTVSDAPLQGIWVAPLDGGAPKQVGKSGAGLFTERDWCPDGKRIVYNNSLRPTCSVVPYTLGRIMPRRRRT